MSAPSLFNNRVPYPAVPATSEDGSSSSVVDDAVSSLLKTQNHYEQILVKRQKELFQREQNRYERHQRINAEYDEVNAMKRKRSRDIDEFVNIQMSQRRKQILQNRFEEDRKLRECRAERSHRIAAIKIAHSRDLAMLDLEFAMLENRRKELKRKMRIRKHDVDVDLLKKYGANVVRPQ